MAESEATAIPRMRRRGPLLLCVTVVWIETVLAQESLGDCIMIKDDPTINRTKCVSLYSENCLGEISNSDCRKIKPLIDNIIAEMNRTTTSAPTTTTVTSPEVDGCIEALLDPKPGVGVIENCTQVYKTYCVESTSDQCGDFDMMLREAMATTTEASTTTPTTTTPKCRGAPGSCDPTTTQDVTTTTPETTTTTTTPKKCQPGSLRCDIPILGDTRLNETAKEPTTVTAATNATECSPVDIECINAKAAATPTTETPSTTTSAGKINCLGKSCREIPELEAFNPDKATPTTTEASTTSPVTACDPEDPECTTPATTTTPEPTTTTPCDPKKNTCPEKNIPPIEPEPETPTPTTTQEATTSFNATETPATVAVNETMNDGDNSPTTTVQVATAAEDSAAVTDSEPASRATEATATEQSTTTEGDSNDEASGEEYSGEEFTEEESDEDWDWSGMGYSGDDDFGDVEMEEFYGDFFDYLYDLWGDYSGEEDDFTDETETELLDTATPEVRTDSSDSPVIVDDKGEVVVPAANETTAAVVDDNGDPVVIPGETEDDTTPVTDKDGSTVPTTTTTVAPITDKDGSVVPNANATVAPTVTDRNGDTVPTTTTTGVPVTDSDGNIIVPTKAGPNTDGEGNATTAAAPLTDSDGNIVETATDKKRDESATNAAAAVTNENGVVVTTTSTPPVTDTDGNIVTITTSKKVVTDENGYVVTEAVAAEAAPATDSDGNVVTESILPATDTNGQPIITTAKPLVTDTNGRIVTDGDIATATTAKIVTAIVHTNTTDSSGNPITEIVTVPQTTTTKRPVTKVITTNTTDADGNAVTEIVTVEESTVAGANSSSNPGDWATNESGQPGTTTATHAAIIPPVGVDGKCASPNASVVREHSTVGGMASEYGEGAVITHTCASNYVFRTSKQPLNIYECLGNATWSSNLNGDRCVPSCTLGTIDFSNAKNAAATTFTEGDRVTLECQTGYAIETQVNSTAVELRHMVSFKCEAGAWAGYEGQKCTATDVICPDPSSLLDLSNSRSPSLSDKEVNGSQPVGTMILHMCHANHVFESTQSPLNIYECTASGAWTGNMKGEACTPFKRSSSDL